MAIPTGSVLAGKGFVACCLVAESCQTLCDPIDCSLPGSSVLGILQARTLEWVAMPSSRGSSRPRDRTASLALAGGFFTTEPLEKDTGFKKLPSAPNPLPMTFRGLELPLGGHQADVCPQLPGERKTGSLQTEKLDRVKFLVPEAHTRKSGLSATGRDRPSGHSGTSGVVGPVGS